MKAIIKYKELGHTRQKTINVEKNEPNTIIRAFINETGKSRYTYITTVKCGRTEYIWNGDACGAGC